MVQYGRWLSQCVVIGGFCWSAGEVMAQQAPPVPPAFPGQAEHQHHAEGAMADDDPVGRRFVPPMQLPPSPPGVESLMDRGTAEEEALGGLTLEMLLSLATQNNPTLVQAQQQVNGTLGKAIQAGLWPNPTFFYVAEQVFVDSPNDTDTPGEFQGALIQQEFVTAHKRDLSRQKYLARTRTAEWLCVAQQWKVCNDVRIHFWETVGHRMIVDQRRELLKFAEDAAVTARERYNLGQATRAELHMSNVLVQQARLDLLRAENMYRSQFGILTSIVGMEMPAQPLSGELDKGIDVIIDFDAAVARLYSESPEILAARAKWQADQITLERERVEPIPNIFVQGGAGYNFVERETVAAAQVFLEVPIWDRNQGTIRQAEADLVRQQAEVRRTELFLRQELSRVYENYLTALQHVMEFDAVILPEARDAYINQLDAYKEDRQNWGDVLDAQREYFDLRRQYIEHLVTWRRNEVLISGFLLHGGLDAAPNPTPPGHIDAVAQPR